MCIYTKNSKFSEKEKKISELSSEIELKRKEYELKEKNVKESYEEQLKMKEEQLEYYKDFKAKQSTKMIGESLEVHCSCEFNRLRPLFKNAYFEKDNDARSGSKGDFIFRDYDDEGNEIVSIMFEMKNEADETSTKHKNEHFLKELDKDRKEKNCEYAVLVSLLEADNDYYNDGIVDVSYLYDKMYVIRPQFFIPLITLIRNLASKSLEYKKELELVKNQKQNELILTFDDDIIYPKDSIAKVMKLHKKYPSSIVINRGYEITFDKNGNLEKHLNWKINSKYAVKKPEKLVFISCGSGALFPYKSLNPEVLNSANIK